MKKLIIIALLIFGCDNEEDMDTCVLKTEVVNEIGLYIRFECYENLYTKKECLDKVNNDAIYYDYVTESCPEFCESKGSDDCVVIGF